jgi:hypothetical protein
MDTRPPALGSDQRGMIMLIGIVMGCLMVGSLWYLIAVGNAILHQERLQDAADALAFQSAIWHARGMNLLALINMLMAAILIVIVALRVAELVVIALLLACHIVTAPTGILEVVCGALDVGSLTSLITLENRIGQPVMYTLQGLTYAEAGVAIAVPYLATGPGLKKTSGFYKEQGVTGDHNVFSLSLLPTSIDVGLKLVGGPVKPRIGWIGALIRSAPGVGSLVVSGDPGPLIESVKDGWPSLPVEDDGFEQLCSRTGELIATGLEGSSLPHMALELLGGQFLPQPVMSAIDQTDQLFRIAIGDVFGAVSVVLCEPLMSMVNRLIHHITHLPNWVIKHGLRFIPGARDIVKMVTGSALGKGFLGTSVSSVHPAALWSIADNGSAFLRVWASAGKPDQSKWAFTRKIQVGAGQAVAAAEYYASCYKVGDFLPVGIQGALLRDCEDDAMWRVGWSARMRRVRPVLDELNASQIASHVVADAVSDALPGFVADATPFANFIDWLFTDHASPVSHALDQLFQPVNAPDNEHRSNIIH